MFRRLPCWIVALLAAGSVAAQAASVADVYKRIKSSVVVIETEQREVDPVVGVNLVRVGGLGSGVLISDSGQVMTAGHVVQTADSVVVRFMSGEKIPARVVSSVPGADLALLQLERKPAVAQVARLGDSDRVEVGDQVFVVGAPFGISHTLTVGHVSARRLENSALGGMARTELLQTDAAINQGNSGGPMFNVNGEVVGIVSYILSHGGGFQGLGFVITSNMARRLLLEERSVWTGLQGRILEEDLAEILNVPQSRALLVEAIAERSPAQRLGLWPGSVRAEIGGIEMIVGGDVILEVMGISLDDEEAAEKIRQTLRRLQPGDEIRVKVLRAGQVLELRSPFRPDPQAAGGTGDS
jgi:S1-C subfamily serine protease